MTPHTTIVIADDHVLVREGLKMLLSAEPGLEVVADTGNGAAVEALVRELRPGLLVLDLELPGKSGIEIAAAIKADASIVCKVLVLTGNLKAETVSRALAAGADGLRDDTISQKVTTALGLRFEDYAKDPTIKYGREKVESGRMLHQAATDDRLIQPRDVLREMLQPLRRMEVQEQSEISAVHVEIHQCHRLPLPGLLHGSREIRGHRARAHPASRPDDADDSARLHLRAGRSPVESLLKPRKGRFHFLARQGLRQKFLHPEPERVQEYLRVRPRGREKHLKIRRGAQQFTDADERLLRAHFVQFEQQHVHRASPLPFGHQIVPPPRKDLFKRLTSRFVPTVNRHCNQSSHAS